MIGAIIAACGLGVTLLLALIALCVLVGRNLSVIDDLKARSKNLDELPKILAEQVQLKDVVSATTRQLGKLTDRMAASERTAETRHEQVLGELRLLRATKASRDGMPAVSRLLPPRPRSPSVPEPIEVTEEDDPQESA